MADQGSRLPGDNSLSGHCTVQIPIQGEIRKVGGGEEEEGRREGKMGREEEGGRREEKIGREKEGGGRKREEGGKSG